MFIILLISTSSSSQFLPQSVELLDAKGDSMYYK